MEVKIFPSLLLIAIFSLPIFATIIEESAKTFGRTKVGNNANQTLKIIQETDKKLVLLQENVVLFLEISQNNSNFLELKNSKNDFDSTSTPNSGEYLPKLLHVDVDTLTTYYEWPIFVNHEPLANDLISKYTIWKILNNAKSVKFILTVNYSPANDSIDIPQFFELAKYTTEFIINLEKFNEGVAILVSNIQNPKDLSLEELNHKFGKALQSAVKTSGNEDINLTFFEKNVLSSDEKGNYPKVGILTSQIKNPGEDNFQLNELKNHEEVIINRIKFVEKDNSDFNYALPEHAMEKVRNNKHIKNVEAEVQNRIKFWRLKIIEEIQQYYQTREKNLIDINDLKKEFENWGQNMTQLEIERANIEKDNKSDLKKQRDFLKYFTKKLVALKVDLSENHFSKILDLYTYLEFLEDYSNTTLIYNLESWYTKDAFQFLNDAKLFYTFLNDFYSLLSDFKIQSIRENHEIRKSFIESECKKALGHEIDLKNVITLLRNMNLSLIEKGWNDSVLENLNEISVDEIKSDRFCKIYNLAMVEPIQITCQESNTLQITGEFIKFSDIPSKNYCGNFKRLELLALNTIFVDVDLNRVGDQLEVVAIAPKWIIYGDRNINLDGKNASEYKVSKANDGHILGFSGADGKQGLPGGNGGHFLGIGNEILSIDENFNEDVKKLIISTKGGAGGKGQDGGNGAKGIDADLYPRDVPQEFIKNKKSPYKLNKMCRNYTSDENVDDYRCLVQETKIEGRPNGDGGDGGKGGEGGKAGNIHFFLSSKNERNFKLYEYSSDGNNGDGGKGGMGGFGSHFNLTNVTFYSCVSQGFLSSKLCTRISNVTNWQEGELFPRGENGTDNFVATELVMPEEAIVTQFPRSINKYKKYLLRSMVDSVRRTTLMKFYERLNDEGSIMKKNITDLYDTLGLVDELKGFEEEVSKLKEYVDLLPFYRSLLRKVSNYIDNPKAEEQGVEYKKVLAHLYTAIWSKICNLERGMQNNLIIDIRKILDSVMEDIQEVRESAKEVKRIKYNKEFKTDINKKIIEANTYVKAIENEIAKIQDHIIEKMHLVMQEHNNRASEKIQTEKELQKLKKEAKTNVILQTVFGILKNVALVVSSVGPWGDVVAGIMQEVVTFAHPIINNESDEPTIIVAAKSVKNLWENSSKHFEKVRNLIRGDDKNKTMGSDKNSLTVNNKNKTEKGFSDYVTHGFSIAESFYDLYSTYKANKSEAREKSESEMVEKEVQKLGKFQEDVYSTMMPMVKNIRDGLDRLQANLSSMSEVALDMNKWKIQETLQNLKKHLQEVTKDFDDIPIIFGSLLDKLIDQLNALINMYDRIQQLQNQRALIDYISEINSPSLNSINLSGELKTALGELDLVLNYNILLEPYEKVMHAFKQFVFPFAEVFLGEFRLPRKLQEVKNSSYVENRITSELKKLHKGLVQIDGLIIRDIDDRQHTTDFSGSSFETPFFKWSQNEYNNQIADLLSGKEIMLKADVKKGINKNAVKFKIIEIRLKATDPRLQKELERDLENFKVYMIHMGNSYYRCGAKYYIINSQIQEISYTFKRNSDSSSPEETSGAYEKLKNGDFILSPYATWYIRLEAKPDVSFDILNKYKYQVDLTLGGYGRFLDLDVDICNSDLSMYYREDASTSELRIIHK